MHPSSRGVRFFSVGNVTNTYIWSKDHVVTVSILVSEICLVGQFMLLGTLAITSVPTIYVTTKQHNQYHLVLIHFAVTFCASPWLIKYFS